MNKIAYKYFEAVSCNSEQLALSSGSIKWPQEHLFAGTFHIFGGETCRISAVPNIDYRYFS